VSDARYELRPIGRVESPLADVAAAPSQGDEGAPEAWIVVWPDLQPATRSLAVGDAVIVVAWLDRADRSVLEVHPRDDPRRPLTGVFSTRSPDRPNPIGLHEVRILAIEGTRLQVSNLEALDGTPVLDLKPVLGPVAER
jgi:tRNA-Thr(GGU) m(6)t(6)A37 methyltransferase TsaA